MKLKEIAKVLKLAMQSTYVYKSSLGTEVELCTVVKDRVYQYRV